MIDPCRSPGSWLAIEFFREEKGRWLADIAALPGVTAHGRTRKEATAAVQALALRLIANRLEHGETVPHDWPSMKAKQALAALLRIVWTIQAPEWDIASDSCAARLAGWHVTRHTTLRLLHLGRRKDLFA
jgi:predicted RNase H-like HicB family nuclease